MKKIFENLLREAQAVTYHGSGIGHVDATRFDPYKSFKFEVVISGDTVFARAGFSKVSGLKMEAEVVEYREGGDSNTVQKSPGLVKYEPLTLERGMSEDNDMYDWANKMHQFALGEASSASKYKANMQIRLKDTDGTVVKVWEVKNCWVSGYETGEMDAQGNNVMIETMTVQHTGFMKIKG